MTAERVTARRGGAGGGVGDGNVLTARLTAVRARITRARRHAEIAARRIAALEEEHGALLAEQAARRDGWASADAVVRVWPECGWRDLWHQNCSHGPGRGIMKRYAGGLTIEDGTTLWRLGCLHCGAQCYAGVDAARRIVTRPVAPEGPS